MPPPDVPAEWFCALLDEAPDVYFRYSLWPSRGFAYVSPSVQALTGCAPQEFYRDPDRCRGLVAASDRHLLRQAVRSRRSRVLRLRVVRQGVTIPVDVRTVAVIRHRQVVAIEGVATLARGTSVHSPSADRGEPTQQRLAALLYEVHDLLHRVMPAGTAADPPARLLQIGALSLDLDRLVVSESGAAVALTSREVLVLRYLLERRGRVVTRQQLLADVWAYTYTGDDRTVDVHISRLRRKLPSLQGRLVAIKHVGYRLEADDAERRIANC